MAALICILFKTLKDAKVTPSRLLISTLDWDKNCKKNFVGTPNQESPKNQDFTAGLVAKTTPNLHIYAYANCLIISAMA